MNGEFHPPEEYERGNDEQKVADTVGYCIKEEREEKCALEKGENAC